MKRKKPTQTDILQYVTIKEAEETKNDYILIHFMYRTTPLTFILQHIEGEEYEPLKIIHGNEKQHSYCECCQEHVRKGTGCNGFTMDVNEKEMKKIVNNAMMVDNQIYIKNMEELLGKNHINGMDKQNIHALMAKFYEYSDHI
jgi:hypothetical protein